MGAEIVVDHVGHGAPRLDRGTGDMRRQDHVLQRHQFGWNFRLAVEDVERRAGDLAIPEGADQGCLSAAAFTLLPVLKQPRQVPETESVFGLSDTRHRVPATRAARR